MVCRVKTDENEHQNVLGLVLIFSRLVYNESQNPAPPSSSLIRTRTCADVHVPVLRFALLPYYRRLEEKETSH